MAQTDEMLLDPGIASVAVGLHEEPDGLDGVAVGLEPHRGGDGSRRVVAGLGCGAHCAGRSVAPAP